MKLRDLEVKRLRIEKLGIILNFLSSHLLKLWIRLQKQLYDVKQPLMDTSGFSTRLLESYLPFWC